MLNSQYYYYFLEKLFHRTRVFNTSGTHVQNYLGKIQVGEGCEIRMWNTAVFSKKKWCALLWYVCTKHFCPVKPQLRQQPVSLTCSPLASPCSNNKHGISKNTILDSSMLGSGQRGGAHMLEILWGARNLYRSQCCLAENWKASSVHRHGLERDQRSKMDLRNGWICIFKPSLELHTLT